MMSLILAASLHIDMYQDRNDSNKTVVIIEIDDVKEIYAVDNNKLEQFVNEMEKKYVKDK